MKEKEKNPWALVSFLTTVNIFLLYKIHKTGNLRDNWECNYVKEFKVYDILVFILLLGLVMAGTKIIVYKVLPYLRRSMSLIRKNNQGGFLEKNGKRKIFIIIFFVWFFFFLVMYPGTAMNDTIFILEDPWMLSRQHPIIYNLYTYGLFRLGSFIWNENFGLALISLIQIAAMDYVLSTAVMLLYNRGIKNGICMLFAFYFAFAPLFSTYAVSAIKDTPFSIFIFYFMILLYEAGMSHGMLWKQRKFCMKMGVCIWGIGGFRSNGLFIAVSVGIFLIIVYWKWYKEIFRTIILAVFILAGMKFMLNPPNIERLFQENVGIQLQQVAAVVNKGKELTAEQETYLYRLLPEQDWKSYAPCCVDNIKWHEKFDRQYLNETKWQFIKLWLDLFPNNCKIYLEAYIMNTYGIWGIETRNGEQYYQKEIYENELNLYQKSPLPLRMRNFFYKYYCNRFTYRYLSEGTAFWIIFVEGLYLLFRKKYKMMVIFSPIYMCFLSLMLAAPIAFAFRYVFVLAMVFPFSMILPLIEYS